MNRKKEHEVRHFAARIAALLPAVHAATGSAPTHVVDFGSGCSYLGRYLAAGFGVRTVAVESRAHVVSGARQLDVSARIAPREPRVRRNKKLFLAMGGQKGVAERLAAGGQCPACVVPSDAPPAAPVADEPDAPAIQYVEHQITDGDLSSVFARTSIPPSVSGRFVVVSLHSCGNLVHHGLRTLTLNPLVSAAAMVGCCYNLMTESLGPPTYKLPGLRAPNERLLSTSAAADPHGFPMSRRLRQRAYLVPGTGEKAEGVRLNITARMMAVQAPSNWSRADSEGFFARHFFRAVLQRVLLDLGLVADPSPAPPAGRSPAGTGVEDGAPLVIGALAKGCFRDFPTYVRGAAAKLARSSAKPMYSYDGEEDARRAERARRVAERLREVDEETLRGYEERFAARKKHLSVTWSLMAFCAQVSEAVIVSDRYAWLKEQDVVGETWVESVFDYAISPRNMVVVGIRKAES
jgi:hypothetical protein